MGKYRIYPDIAYREYGEFRVYYKTSDKTKKLYSVEGSGIFILDYISANENCSYDDLKKYLAQKYPTTPPEQFSNDLSYFLESMIKLNILEEIQ